MLVIQNLDAWPWRFLNLMEGQRLISGDQTEPGVQLNSTCLDLVVSFNFSAAISVMFRSGTLPPKLVSLMDCYLQPRSIYQPTWHRSSLFVKSPLYYAFSMLIVSFKLFFQSRLSSFSFKRNANEVNVFWGCRLGFWKTACSWREMSSDIVCCLSVFVDMAIYRRPPSVSIVEAKYRIFYLRQCLMFILNLAIKSSVVGIHSTQ